MRGIESVGVPGAGGRQVHRGGSGHVGVVLERAVAEVEGTVDTADADAVRHECAAVEVVCADGRGGWSGHPQGLANGKRHCAAGLVHQTAAVAVDGVLGAHKHVAAIDGDVATGDVQNRIADTVEVFTHPESDTGIRTDIQVAALHVHGGLEGTEADAQTGVGCLADVDVTTVERVNLAAEPFDITAVPAEDHAAGPVLDIQRAAGVGVVDRGTVHTHRIVADLGGQLVDRAAGMGGRGDREGIAHPHLLIHVERSPRHVESTVEPTAGGDFERAVALVHGAAGDIQGGAGTVPDALETGGAQVERATGLHVDHSSCGNTIVIACEKIAGRDVHRAAVLDSERAGGGGGGKTEAHANAGGEGAGGHFQDAVACRTRVQSEGSIRTDGQVATGKGDIAVGDGGEATGDGDVA